MLLNGLSSMMESQSALVGVRSDVMLMDEEGCSEVLESIVAKQSVTLCGTINTASSGNVGRTQRACESYSSEAFPACSIEM